MQVIDCIWEQKNTGKKTLEIIIEETDLFDGKQIEQQTKDYEYVVVKVSMNMPEFNIGLGALDFLWLPIPNVRGIKPSILAEHCNYFLE